MKKVHIFRALLIFFLLHLSTSLNAEPKRYDLSWIGSGGYSADGYFIFDDSLVLGDVVEKNELMDFNFTVNTPEGNSLQSYDLYNQSYFEFHFDITNEIILYGSNQLNFTVGEFQEGSPASGLIVTNPSGYVFATPLGCGGFVEPELWFDNGFCMGDLLDSGGTDIQVSLSQESAVWLVQGTPYDDLLEGSSHLDRILCGSGNDIANGLEGNDYLSGYKGDDILHGGAGNDILLGGVGNDILIGGLGKDKLRGYAGNDIFRFTSLLDSTKENPDRIILFEKGSDLIDLSGLGFTEITQGYPIGNELAYLYLSSSNRTYVRSRTGFFFFLDGNIELGNEDFIF